MVLMHILFILIKSQMDRNPLQLHLEENPKQILIFSCHLFTVLQCLEQRKDNERKVESEGPRKTNQVSMWR